MVAVLWGKSLKFGQGSYFPTSQVRLLRLALVMWDVSCWFAATLLTVAARYDFVLTGVQWSSIIAYAAVGCVLQLVLGSLVKLYQGGSRVGSFVEATALAGVSVTAGLVLAITYLGFGSSLPRGVALTVPLGALVLMAAGRFMARGLVVRWRAAHRPAGQERVFIYGAGNTGRQVGQLVWSDPGSPYRVVGFIDDDKNKQNWHLGVAKVVGRRKDLVAQASRLGASTVILAISRATATFMQHLSNELDAAGLRLVVMPPWRDIVDGRVELKQLHEFDVTDLLGRDPITTDLAKIAGYLKDKVVLVTGAGGSIGSEIARQVHTFGPKELVLLDRDESGLHAVQLSIYGQGLLDSPDMVLCDIRDKEALDEVFQAHQPDVVFHAAALKHLPLLEQYPKEGWKTNVLGTLNVLECAAAHGVERFVNISTDKAADPTSVLGRTKRRAEELTSWFAERGHGTYLSVRFGNVLGSRGSVLFTFAKQIELGGPVTVVDPEITRYFMTIPEACQLVIQAGAIGDPGDVLVLDMGEPVKIVDVARRMIKRSGKNIPIVFTGLRPGEKLNEVLFSDGELARPTSHPLIREVHVPPADPDEVLGLLSRSGATAPQAEVMA